MIKVTMPDPVAYAHRDILRRGNCVERIYPTAKHGSESVGLITTEQAEAYADARVREALEQAYQSARQVEEKLLADHLHHVSGPAAANYVANRIRALLPSTPA